jgi:hypothetical protein
MTDDVDTLVFGALVIIKKSVLSNLRVIAPVLTTFVLQPQLEIEWQ